MLMVLFLIIAIVVVLWLCKKTVRSAIKLYTMQGWHGF